jgi:dehydrogenase/reductase SDR family protein 1
MFVGRYHSSIATRAEREPMVALVTGASRGMGRGIAIGLGEAGATVYLTGRSLDAGPGAGQGSIAETGRLVEAAGGRAVPIRCDHRVDADVAAIFARIQAEQGRLDLLVNNATAIPADLDVIFGAHPFWEVDPTLWDDLFAVGLRSHFIASQLAAQLMIPRERGLIVNISSRAAQVKAGVVPYAVAKAALDRLTADAAVELKPHGVAVVSLWPPPSQTESMLASAGSTGNVSRWSDTRFTGRVVAALAMSSGVMERSGKAFGVRDLAKELGVPDTIPAA